MKGIEFEGSGLRKGGDVEVCGPQEGKEWRPVASGMAMKWKS